MANQKKTKQTVDSFKKIHTVQCFMVSEMINTRNKESWDRNKK